jgi:hypothetical protein
LTLALTRADGPFTTRWYNDPAPEGSGGADGAAVPVWSIAPQSLIVAPVPDAKIEVSKPIEIWGWAWADGGVRSVDVAVDGDWLPATLEAAAGRSWQRFALSWVPRRRGVATLASRASSSTDAMQPASGRRNAIYALPVKVV